MRRPRCGDIVRVDGQASVQFAGRPMWFRVDAELHGSHFDGWTWLTGCRLSELLAPVQRREIYVQPGGLTLITDEERDQIERARVSRRRVRTGPHARAQAAAGGR